MTESTIGLDLHEQPWLPRRRRRRDGGRCRRRCCGRFGGVRHAL